MVCVFLSSNIYVLQKKKSDDIKRKISSLVQNTYAYPN